MSKYDTLLQEKLGDTYSKLSALNNEKLNNFLGEYIELCSPDSVFFCDDSDADAEYIRNRSLELGEEKKLARSNTTMHYDGIGDQARDKPNTKYMVPADKIAAMGKLNCIDTDEAMIEVKSIMKDMMVGKKAIVKLFCECPTHSPFSIACVQFTDSCYVAHSEDILYRRGYQQFMDMEDKDDFFRFCHSAGVLDDKGCCVNLQNRRIFQDLDNNMVFSMNAQYAGNTVGLKKHSMRLAINKSGQEGWLCEHMFIMNIPNEAKARSTYFAGAFPSACGKTSTAMVPGEKIVGDDIAYFKNIDGEFRAANVECGIFGIVKDVNADDDPVIFSTLMEEKEMIFSNVLTGSDNNPYWTGIGVETPETGVNFAGEWSKGCDTPVSHGNARYTLRMDYLKNLDSAWNDKNGVKIDGVLYGGRDSDTCVPCEESSSWEDGIIMKACTLESETTSATIGQEGVRVPQPMANLDFITYPIGDYVKNNIDFGHQFGTACPKVFSTNYFLLTKEGQFCTSKLAKKVWLHWFEGRTYGEYTAYETPTGFIPKYEDLKVLFKDLLGEDYSLEEYTYQFSIRCDAWVAKLERAKAFFVDMAPTLSQDVYAYWDKKIEDFKASKAKYGNDIKPGDWKGL